MAEHRIYLSLAAVLTAAVAGCYLLGRRLADRRVLPRNTLAAAGGGLAVLIGVTLAALTYQRNTLYASSLSIWEDTVRNVPGNSRAHYNYAVALDGAGRFDQAMVHYRKALELRPDMAEAHNNLGALLFASGRTNDGISHYEMAFQLKPTYAMAHHNLANALVSSGRYPEAVAEFRRAIEIEPHLTDAHRNLALLLITCSDASIRDAAEAVKLAEQAADISSRRDASVLDVLAGAYAETGRFADAVRTAQEAQQLAVRQDELAMARAINDRLAFYRAGRSLPRPPLPQHRPPTP